MKNLLGLKLPSLEYAGGRGVVPKGMCVPLPFPSQALKGDMTNVFFFYHSKICDPPLLLSEVCVDIIMDSKTRDETLQEQQKVQPTETFFVLCKMA